MRLISALVVLMALLVAGGTPAAQPQSPAPAYLVIVHPSNPVRRLDRKFVADVFLGKKTRWAGDRVIRPVDLTPRSLARRRFAEAVLGRSLAAVRSYWNQLVFSGRGLPPPELASDGEVIAHVARNPGAIGYVSGSAELSRVKVVEVR